MLIDPWVSPTITSREVENRAVKETGEEAGKIIRIIRGQESQERGISKSEVWFSMSNASDRSSEVNN